MAEVAYRNRKYEPGDMEEYIEKAAQWICEGDNCGLLICGAPGNGKTTLMKSIQVFVNNFDIRCKKNTATFMDTVDAREIIRMNKDSYELFKAYRNRPMLAIDDMGVEPTEVLDYGNVLNPVIDLLSHRYNEQLVTVVTTNLSPKEIRQKYGDRIADRFNEMMTKIIFRNQSYRTINAQK